MHALKDLEKQLTLAHEQVIVGAAYCHYRNPELQYKVLHLGIQEASEKICVIYQALYGDKAIWVRDLDVWLAQVEHEGKLVPRFRAIG
ncbi:MAG: hypothetical protein K0S74_1820 [Chlamydiales bacterium]|jgi:hypothetical protein|nr:hypothetical protein [Chlamydiales bacterium]